MSVFDKVPTGNGETVGVIARKAGTSSYRLKLRLLPAGAVHLAWSRVVSGVETTVSEVVVRGLTYNAGDTLRLRFVVTRSGPATSLSGTVWPVAGPEPSSPQLSATDSTAALQTAGAIGLLSGLGSTVTNTPVTFSYDNLNAVVPTGADQPPIAAFTVNCAQLSCQFDGTSSSRPRRNDGQLRMDVRRLCRWERPQSDARIRRGRYLHGDADRY